MELVTIDKDILEFLRAIYFGSYVSGFEAASSRAYRDMNRTIRFNGLDEKKRESLRKKVYIYLEKEIKDISVDSQIEFDKWHFKVCDYIRTLYRNEGVLFTYGQSQKWVNMTFKYLYIIGEMEKIDYFNLLHIPLDNYVFDIAVKEFGGERPSVPWSRWDDYYNQYLPYQEMIRQNVSEEPLRWEFKYWLKEARNRG